MPDAVPPPVDPALVNPTPHKTPPGRSQASRYWSGNLDPQNLERKGAGPELEAELDFAWTPDFVSALDWLEPERRAFTVDLGAGLGAHALALARRGARVVAVDTAPGRLHALRERARRLGLSDRITTVVAAAEALPFAAGSLPGLYTRSVLIHVDLPAAAAELARTLAPGGRAALIEPQPGNPFAAAYRAVLAPRAWRGITRYFDAEAQAIFCRAVGPVDPRRAVEPHYLLGFLAFIFQFGWPRRAWFRAALAVIGSVDRVLFRVIPPLRRLAWFGLIRLEKPGGEDRAVSS